MDEQLTKLQKLGITEYTEGELIHDFDMAVAYKEEQARIFKLLDAADHSDIWKVYSKKIPDFQQNPVYNPITIIKEATKASIMPTAYVADFRPMTLDAKPVTEVLNKYLKMKWETSSMDTINSTAADYTYLHGTAGVLFGWRDDIIDGEDASLISKIFRRSEIQAKAIHPSNLFPDPGAANIDEAQYIYIAERKTKQFLKSIPRFATALKEIEETSNATAYVPQNYILDEAKNNAIDVVTFITVYKRVLEDVLDPITGEVIGVKPRIDVVYMAGTRVIDATKGIQPAVIPFVTLYDEVVPNNFWGISKCYKVLSMVLTLNKLDSIDATAIVKHQNPIQFVNGNAGLNLAEFQRKRDNPDRAFVVNGDPNAVFAEQKRPDPIKNMEVLRQYLISGIREVSGVDSIYQGSNFGSIQTTGGVDQAIQRATLRDNVRVRNINDFIKKEIEMILQFYIIHGAKEKFFAPTGQRGVDMNTPQLEFDPTMLIGREDIEIVISESTPRTSQSYEDAALKLMELNMKYAPSEKGYPDIITPEEVIGWLNIPFSQKQVLLERMNLQYQNLKMEEYMAVLTGVGTLVEGGMDPEMALQEVITQMQQSQVGQLPATRPNAGMGGSSNTPV